MYKMPCIIFALHLHIHQRVILSENTSLSVIDREKQFISTQLFSAVLEWTEQTYLEAEVSWTIFLHFLWIQIVADYC